MADRGRHRTGHGRARGGGSGRDRDPDRSGRRFGGSGLADQENRPACLLGPAVQAPGGGQIEAGRIAAQFQHDRGESPLAGGLLGDPQRVPGLVRRAQEEIAGRQTAKSAQAGRIGKSGLAENLRRADPAQSVIPLHWSGPAQQTGKTKGKPRHRAGVAGLLAMDLDQGGARQAAAQGGIEARGAGRQKSGPETGFPPGGGAVTQHEAIVVAGPCQPFGQDTFDPRDFPTQSDNSLPRHGGLGHDSRSKIILFLLCSYGFQSPPQESSRVDKNLFRPGPGSGNPASANPALRGPSQGREQKAIWRPKDKNMARIYQTRAWHDQLSPSVDEMEILALEAYAHLPADFRALTGEIVIQIAEFPTEEIMDDLSLETPFDLLGLFEGRGIAERWNPATGEGPNRITLYRRAILDYWAENEETLGDIVTHVLIHELGHHFGLSDEDMEKIEESVA